MKRAIVFFCVCTVALSGGLFAQVIFDFETDNGGFTLKSDPNYDLITSVAQASDPSGLSGGALAVTMDFNASTGKKGNAYVAAFDPGDARVITFYVWLPSGIPDSTYIKYFAQDKNWTYTDAQFWVSAIPKEVWFPLQLNLEAANIKSSSFDVAEGALQTLGIQFISSYEHDADASWTGTAYIDNVTLLGVNPTVLFDFESDDSGFILAYDFFTSLVHAADPAAASSGALAATLNADLTANKKGNVYKNTKIGASDAHMATVYVWCPADLPNNVYFKFYFKDNNWTTAYSNYLYYASAIPKEVWYPLQYDLEAAHLKSSSFDVAEGDLQTVGLEVQSYGLSGADTLYTGTIYIDNISFLGVEVPDERPRYVIADFEDEAEGTAGFKASTSAGYAALTNVARIADPTFETVGVLGTDWNFSLATKGWAYNSTFDLLWDSTGYAAGGPLDTGATAVSIDIFIPGDFPVSGESFGLVLRDHKNWKWYESKFTVDGSNLVAGQWNTLEIDVLYYFGLENKFFPYYTVDFGVQISHSSNNTWTGSILFDNVTLIGVEAPEEPIDETPKYVVAAFEKEAAGVQGYAKSTTAGFEACTGVARIADPTSVSEGVLSGSWDFSRSAKGYIGNGSFNLFWADTGTVVDTGATAIRVDVWIPADFPVSDGTLGLVLRDKVGWTWNETKYPLSDSITVVPGAWNTFSLDVLQYILNGTFNPYGTSSFGIQLQHSSNTTWQGDVYFDNVTLVGVEEPEGVLVSPISIGAVETYSDVGIPFDYVHIVWVDNTIGSETYRVYMSPSEITDLDAAGVTRIAREIPHGTEYWNYRPYSRTAEENTYYFAVIAMGADGTLSDLNNDCKVGPVTITTSATAKALYDPWFAQSFVLDGLDTEFLDMHKAYLITAEVAGGTDTAGWTPASTDMSFKTTFVVDDDYLYISTDVTDNDLNASGNEAIIGGQAWMGDALEFYMGIYDVNPLHQLHGYRDVMTEGTGDYRISFCAWGEVQSATAVHAFPGLQSTHYQKFSGDGYIIEARIALDSLAQGGNIDIADGVMLPLRIDGTDLDPTDNDETRSLIAQWGSNSNSENWLRPSCWGYLEVLVDPSILAIEESDLPKQFRLYPNYPNPFNPVTTIQFELPKATDISMAVYDLLGNEVRTLVREKKDAGTYFVQWNGRNNQGAQVTSGIYFCRFTTLEYTRTQKMIFLK